MRGDGQGSDGGARHVPVLTVAVGVPLSMAVTFAALRRSLPPRRAYDAGFAVYWLGWGLAYPLRVLGPRRATRLLTTGRRPAPGEAAMLLVPVVGAIVTELVPARRLISPSVALVMVTTAAVNAASEELLWRGMFLEERDAMRGAVLPLLGFTLWHLAPQLVLPPRRGRLGFIVGSALVGAASTHVARRTGGLRAAVVAHFLTDACGAGAARFRLGLPSAPPDRTT